MDPTSKQFQLCRIGRRVKSERLCARRQKRATTHARTAWEACPALTRIELDYFCCNAVGLLSCRFSDAGNDELTTRHGGRRPKSAKARNRRKWSGDRAGLYRGLATGRDL